ncbi:MAG: hypothetical protein LBR29_00545 [Methylobacteriaceae bacterium]|jgi:uncharacterized Zn finger protein|nr:hypothetical protein [Methylobacteriaceae bacterium]
MGWGWGYEYYDRPSVAEQRKTAEKRRKQLEKKLGEIHPVLIEGRKIAKTWWGIAWNKNLESYADFENRLSRGRSYCTNGFVLDLGIREGEIKAKVSGSSIYDVKVKIDRLDDKKWQKIVTACAQRVENIGSLVEGKFPQELADVFMKRGDGLFPGPRQIHMSCSCPDGATLCKHVAATLYGVGNRLDNDPLLFFKLRGIDPDELIRKSVDEKMKNLLVNAGKKTKRVIPDKDVARIFGVEL